MKRITYKDLQYPREEHYYTKLKPSFDRIKENHAGFEHKIARQEENFFNILSNSVRIDGLDRIGALVTDINSHLDTEFDIDIFLYQSPVSNAMCIPHYSLTDDEKVRKLIILVSQHFFNNLDERERTTILGHELAHLLFGHVKIPANLILQEDLNLSEAGDLKSDVLKWSICCEITCDIFGYVSNNQDKNAFSTAMLKYTTGLHSNTLQHFGDETLVQLVLNQYDDISDSIYEGILSTHPLTPLRLKIIENISETPLVQNYGTEQPEDAVAGMKEEFSAIIDGALDDIYPELTHNGDLKGKEILLDLAIAVALADGKVSKEEMECIGQIISEKERMKKRFKQVKQQVTQNNYAEIASKLVSSSVKRGRSQSLKKKDILNLMRQLIVVAASDSVISKNELQTIHRFGKEFDFTKQDIVLLSKQLGF